MWGSSSNVEGGVVNFHSASVCLLKTAVSFQKPRSPTCPFFPNPQQALQNHGEHPNEVVSLRHITLAEAGMQMSSWQIAFCPEVHPEVKKKKSWVHSTASVTEWFIKRPIFVGLLALTDASSAPRLGFMVNQKALMQQEEIGILQNFCICIWFAYWFSSATERMQTLKYKDQSKRYSLSHHVYWIEIVMCIQFLDMQRIRPHFNDKRARLHSFFPTCTQWCCFNAQLMPVLGETALGNIVKISLQYCWK